MNKQLDDEEIKRLEALEKYAILDSGAEARFDDICHLAANICKTPMGFVGFVAEDREWFKATCGWPLKEIKRVGSMCSESVKRNTTYIIQDARMDPIYRDNPFVVAYPFISFYAGAVVRTREGYAIGALCVLDHIPRTLSSSQINALESLARQVETLLELRRTIVELETVITERNHIEFSLMQTKQDMEATLAELSKAVATSNKLAHTSVTTALDGIQISQYFNADFPGIFFILNDEGCMLGWNRHLEEVTGYTDKEIAHRYATDFFETQELKTLISDKIREAFEKGNAAVEANVMRKDGIKIPYYLASARVHLHGKILVVGMGIDISATYRSEETFQLRNRAMQASVNAIIITDLNGVAEYVNPAFETMTGYHVVDILGQNCSILQGSDRIQPELDNLRHAMQERRDGSAVLRNYRKNGELFWNAVHIAPVRNQAGIVTHFVGVLNDITELKRYEGQLEQRANFDALTGLANRNLLKDRIRQAVMHAQRNKQIVTVGFVDLDNFKTINDQRGHDVGDIVLRTVAERLKACVRAEDTVARYGGDEFAFVLTEQVNEENVSILMRRILRTIAQPIMIGNEKLTISCSIGISFYPRDGLDVETLLRHADVAMYRAKESGRNIFLFYTNQLTQKIIARLSLEGQLRKALDKDELHLEYIPLVDLKTGSIVGAESKLVWQPSDGSTVDPADYLSLAEETGLIIPIGEWMMNRACSDNMILQRDGLRPIRIAVKIFASQFKVANLRKLVNNALALSHMECRLLDLELTENLLMQNPELSIQILSELKARGLILTANDFGTGYSSLMYLQRFPLDLLKIDASFIEGIGHDVADANVARSVISLAHSLDRRVTAEGVQSDDQLAFLRANGCDEIEGDLISAAVPLAQLNILLREDKLLPAL